MHRFVGLIVLLLLSEGCRPEQVAAPLDADTTGPQIRVFYPGNQGYDFDGDSLVDVYLTWRDTGGWIDLDEVKIRSLSGINGTATDSSNLLDHWRILQKDSGVLHIQETRDHLLRGGPNQLEISVRDTAGNQTLDTIEFSLPHGLLLKTLNPGVVTSGHGIGATVCPDDLRAYVTLGRSLVVIDADSLRVLAAVRHDLASDVLSVPLCVPGDPVLYVTDRVERFNRTTMQWLPRATGSFGSVGIAQSRSDHNLLYVGETESGGIAIIDRARGTRSADIGIPWNDDFGTEYVFDVAVLNGDSKLYFTRYLDGGVLVADPRTGTILKHIGVGGPTWPDSGRTDAFVLSHDDQSLYVAVLDGDPRGVVEINTVTDQVVRTLSLSNYVPQEIALSPSGRRLFVTTQDRFTTFPSRNVLIDVDAWQVLTEFPRPRIGTLRFDGGVAFHPNGKLVFVGRDHLVDVYLIRE